MAASPKKFAQLLTEGIYTIKRRESRPINVIQDELGYALEREGGTSIEYWRKGHIPPKPDEVGRLAHELVRRGDLGQEWLSQFLASAGHLNVTDLEREILSNSSRTAKPSAEHLPPKSFRELVGRDGLVDDILQVLQDPGGRWLVAVDGMGGIGKTSLVREVVDRCLEQGSFDAAVWVSAAKRDTKVSDRADTVLLTFESVLDAIGTQLGDRDFHQLKLAEKQDRGQALLQTQRVLVVLDNLETAGESQDDIVHRLRPLLTPSKALLTSRHRFRDEVYSIHLTGLDETGADCFIRQEAVEKGIERVEHADSGDLALISQTTNGSPLAMKLVAGQLDHLPMDVVLERLRTVQFFADGTEANDYNRFYRFVFMPSWELLVVDGKKLLVSMSHFEPGSGGTFAAVKATSGLSDHLLGPQIDQLWRLSFLEVGDSSSLRHIRYYLHALTQYFVLSDIVQELT